MEQGPWLFRYWAVLLRAYDGFTSADEVDIYHLPIWLQMPKLPDDYCKKELIEKLLKNPGEVLVVRITSHTRGDYIRVRVKHDVRKPLTKFVRIVRAKVKHVYAVRYDKPGAELGPKPQGPCSGSRNLDANNALTFPQGGHPSQRTFPT